MTAQPGDVILYSNSWSYTRLGKIEGLSESELRSFLKAGNSNISVTLSLSSGTTAINEIRGTTAKDTYYSLNGQRVANPSHGIYVKNGNKVVIN